jgi:hypothetical protein
LLELPDLSVQTQVVQGVTGNYQLAITNERFFSFLFLLAEDSEQAVFGNGCHLGDFVVAECTVPETRGYRYFVEEVEVVEVIVWDRTGTRSCCPACHQRRRFFLSERTSVGQWKLNCEGPEVWDGAFHESLHILEMVEQVVPKVVLRLCTIVPDKERERFR